MTSYPIEYTYDRHDGGIHHGMAATEAECLAAWNSAPRIDGTGLVAVSARIVSREAGTVCRSRSEIERHWASEIEAGWVTPIQVYGGWVASVETWDVDYEDAPVHCQSPDGWPLHAPGTEDDAIADGSAPYILAGPGRPTAEHMMAALRLHAAGLRTGSRVEAGAPGCADHDVGRIVGPSTIARAVTVSWDSGVATPCPIADLRPVR